MDGAEDSGRDLVLQLLLQVTHEGRHLPEDPGAVPDTIRRPPEGSWRHVLRDEPAPPPATGLVTLMDDNLLAVVVRD